MKNEQKRAKKGRPRKEGLSKTLTGMKLRKIQGEEKNQDFAEKYAVVPNTLRRYVRGDVLPSGDFLLQLQRTLGVSIDWLLDDSQPVEPVIYRDVSIPLNEVEALRADKLNMQQLIDMQLEEIERLRREVADVKERSKKRVG